LYLLVDIFNYNITFLFYNIYIPTAIEKFDIMV